jgi:hypothetical protein
VNKVQQVKKAHKDLKETQENKAHKDYKDQQVQVQAKMLNYNVKNV